MYRPGDDVLWAGLPGYEPAVALRAAKWLLLLCAAWLALLILTLQPARTAIAGEPCAGSDRSSRRSKPRVTPPLPRGRRSTTSEPMALTADEARAFNATVPFVDGPISAARKLVYDGSHDDRERALTCLASAVWYEAGDDKIGEQAVAQVVLNRVRHPAFPKTICGVVFEGASRRTGCQFTFTCDGSLQRTPSADAWRRARAIADRALSGYVFKLVGNATHYHTDWVVPYWSDTLDKLVEVHSHLFYRWRGDWGRAAAFTRQPGGAEQLDPRIARLADPKVVDVKLADNVRDEPGPRRRPVENRGWSAASDRDGRAAPPAGAGRRSCRCRPRQYARFCRRSGTAEDAAGGRSRRKPLAGRRRANRCRSIRPARQPARPAAGLEARPRKPHPAAKYAPIRALLAGIAKQFIVEQPGFAH